MDHSLFLRLHFHWQYIRKERERVRYAEPLLLFELLFRIYQNQKLNTTGNFDYLI